jgi:hypothetical protein
MNRFRLMLNVAAVLTLSLVCAGVARAQAQQQVYVTANRGTDINPCTRTSPCRSIQHALAASVVKQGGHVIILDGGDYAPFSISNFLVNPPTVTSVTVEAPPGVVANITATGGQGTAAVLVLVGTSDKVVLRGLTLHGRPADAGINFAAGRWLFVENCIIDGFDKAGLDINRNVANDVATVFVTDSVFRNQNLGLFSSGISLANSGSNSFVIASADNCRFENNAGVGVLAGDNAHVTVQRSVAIGNGQGFSSIPSTPGLIADLNIENSLSAYNTVGIFSSGNNGNVGTIRVSNSAVLNNIADGLSTGAVSGKIYVAFSTISGNLKGLRGAPIISLGNNRLFDNGTDGSFSGSIPQQ